jgi:hypothetical protein
MTMVQILGPKKEAPARPAKPKKATRAPVGEKKEKRKAEPVPSAEVGSKESEK